jgi:hypothetical protein
VTISEPDEKWTEEQLTTVFKKPFRKVCDATDVVARMNTDIGVWRSLEDFAASMMHLKDHIEKDPRRRTFGEFVYLSNLVLGPCGCAR